MVIYRVKLPPVPNSGQLVPLFTFSYGPSLGGNIFIDIKTSSMIKAKNYIMMNLLELPSLYVFEANTSYLLGCFKIRRSWLTRTITIFQI